MGHRAGATGYREIEAWVKSLPQPWRVTYEAGPTGFGLAGHLNGSGIDTVVAAPLKLQLPAGDKVMADARDALHLARLLKLGEIVEVTAPRSNAKWPVTWSVAVRTPRVDVMRARHRVSTLRLRHGIIYSGGATWTQTHDRWLRFPAVRFCGDPDHLRLGL